MSPSAISGPRTTRPSPCRRDADGARARRRFLADARRVRAAGPDRRSGDRTAVRRQRRFPRDRISPQAAALLGYYPLPNLDAAGGYNYQTPIVTAIAAGQRPVADDAAAASAATSCSARFAYQRTTTDTDQRVRVRRLDRSRRASTPASTGRAASRSSCRCACAISSPAWRRTSTPYFANRTNVSGDAGIAGNNQDPVNWGPPALTFSSGVAGLADGQYASNRNLTHAWNAEMLLEPRPPQLHVRRRRPPAAVRRAVAAGSARRVHVHRRGHRLRLRRLPARHSARQRRSRSATPTSTSAAARTTPTSPTTGGSVRR